MIEIPHTRILNTVAIASTGQKRNAKITAFSKISEISTAGFSADKKTSCSKNELDCYFANISLEEIPKVDNSFRVDWIKSAQEKGKDECKAGLDFLLQACYEDRYGRFDVAISPKLKSPHNTYKYGKGKWVTHRGHQTITAKEVGAVFRPQPREQQPEAVQTCAREDFIVSGIREIDEAFANDMMLSSAKLRHVITKVRDEWKISVFLSSPFDGCEEERELFMQQFVPNLTKLCMERGVVFTVIDMRWGISQEMVDSDSTLLACLSELDKCDILLGYFGARYGSSALLAKNQGWIHKAIEKCMAHNPGLFGYLNECLDQSITEMEWRHGFLQGNNDANASKPIPFFMYRSAEYDVSKADEAMGRGDSYRASCYRIENQESAEAALNLRELVKQKCTSSETGCHKGYLIEEYNDPHVAAALMNHICTKLITHILEHLEIKCSSAGIPHMIFARKKLSMFVDYDEYVGRAILFILRNNKGYGPLLALCGQSGSGKSSLMAGIVQKFWSDDAKFDVRDNYLIYYFVGCNVISTDLRNMLCLIYEEFLIYLRKNYPHAMDALLPFDNYDLNEIFPKIIDCFKALARKPCRLIIIIDAINQLADEPYNDLNDIPSMLKWLPDEFPPSLKVVVSCINDSTISTHNSATLMFSHLKSRVVGKEVKWLEIEPFDEDQRRDVVEMWHGLFSKTVDEAIMAPVWESEICRIPVVLSFVMKHLVLFGSWATLTRKDNNIRDKLLAAKSLSELIMMMVEQVEVRASRDTSRNGTVRAILMYIYCSREGLTMAELTDLITQNWKLVDPTLPTVGPGFWITLISFSMEHLLEARQGLYNFSHDSVRQAVEKTYFGEGKLLEELIVDDVAREKAQKIKSDIHRRLALYFTAACDADDSPMTENTRVRREAMYQESQSGTRPSVLVATRVRPLNAREMDAAANRPIVTMWGKKTMVMNPKTLKDDVFTLDFALDSSYAASKAYISQEHVYTLCGEDVVGQILDGINVSVLAYGHTGSGKSYTMFGTEEAPGLIPRILRNLFVKLDVKRKQEIWSSKMESTMVEVYMDKYRDLLNGGLIVTVSLVEEGVRNSVRKQVKLKGAVVRPVTGIADVNDILATGIRLRETSSTAMNDLSSRSHCILTIYVHQEYIPNSSITRDSKLNLVDLAGSEKGYQRSGCCKKVQKEGSIINASLAALNSCIRALISSTSKRSSQHIPYRESKLTWLLQDSLGGHSRLVLLATISPAELNYCDSKSTLEYASKAKRIPTDLIRNKDDKFLRDEAQRVRLAEFRKQARRDFLKNVSASTVQCCPACQSLWAEPLSSHNVTCETALGGCGTDFCFLCAVSKDVIAAHGTGYHRVGCEFRTDCCAAKCLETGSVACITAQCIPDQCSSCKTAGVLCKAPPVLTEQQISQGFTLLQNSLIMGGGVSKPKPHEESKEQIAAFISGIPQLSLYSSIFSDNDVDFTVIYGLEDDDIKCFVEDVGINSMVHKTRLTAELIQLKRNSILKKKVADAGLIMTPDVAKEVMRIVNRAVHRLDGFDIAGAVETILGRAKLSKSKRLAAAAIEGRTSGRSDNLPNPKLLLLEDFVSEILPADKARAEFASLEYCDEIYAFIDRLEATQMQARSDGKSLSDLLVSYHMVITGPAGTGKSTAARKFGQVFYNLEFLPRDSVLETSGKSMQAGHMGGTPLMVSGLMGKAKGGVLLIDEAYGLYPERGNYGDEAIQTLLDNMSKPEFQGNLLVILCGQTEHIEALFQVSPALRRRFDKKRIVLKSWTSRQATDAVVNYFKREGLRLTDGTDIDDDAEEELFQRFGKLVRLPGWSSARDVYESIIPAMYTARAYRLQSMANKSVNASVQMEASKSNHTEVDWKAPYTEDDVSEAFRHILKSSQESQKARDKVLLQSLNNGTREVGHEFSKNAQPESFRPMETENYHHVGNEITDEDGNEITDEDGNEITDEDGNEITDEDENEMEEYLWASLEEACKELGYDLARMEEIFSTRNFPDELLALIRQKTRMSVEFIKPTLAPHIGRLLQNMHTLIQQMAEERSREEHVKQEKLRKLGRCPMDFEWLKVGGGYRCVGGTHFCTDYEIAAYLQPPQTL